MSAVSDVVPDVAAPGFVRPERDARLDLFCISFVILFFELACIRWFGSTVIFLTFFTNLVLMACFLGMSVGLLTARQSKDYLLGLVPLTLLAIVLATLTLGAYESFSKVKIDVGGQASPQQIYFGTEYRANDPSRVVIPIEAIAGVFFVLIASMFVGLGQVMGRAFNAIPNRVAAYTIDIAGSLCGIVAFGMASYLRMPPLVWFGLAFLVVLRFLRPLLQNMRADSKRRLTPALQLVALLGILAVTGIAGASHAGRMSTLWSPYYKINYVGEDHAIITNNIGHQSMVSIGKSGPAYALPHLLNRDAGNAPYKDVLIIGAGSGNDVQAARSFGATSIDAVEIDPVIQNLGRQFHPNRPYDDNARVHVHLDDGRSWLKKTNKKYDLVIYALVDSLVLHSGYSSLRLESFLFTREAFQDVRARLKPNGVFAMYNFYRQGWVVARLVKMSGEVFGAPPLVASLPYQKDIALTTAQGDHITFILNGSSSGNRNTGRIGAIRQTLQNKPFFWLNKSPRFNLALNGFGATPPHLAQANANHWFRIGPARVDTSTTTLTPADDWPFLYLRERAIPALNLRGMAMVAILSLGVLLYFAPQALRSNNLTKASAVTSADETNSRAMIRESGGRLQLNGQMFFLGAGFMLLETKGVVHMALLFGSTWVVNSIVFGAILLMILMSNLFVLKTNPRRVEMFYVLLFMALLVNTLVPMNVFLSLPGAARVVASCAVVFVPVFFAGVVFAVSFRDSRRPDIDFGSNVGGVILGGLSEYFSLVLGFNHLLFIAIGFYLLSYVFKPRHEV